MKQIGRKFACSGNNRGHVKYAQDHYLAELEDEAERELELTCMAAAQKALYYHTGVEVSGFVMPTGTFSVSDIKRTFWFLFKVTFCVIFPDVLLNGKERGTGGGESGLHHVHRCWSTFSSFNRQTHF